MGQKSSVIKILPMRAGGKTDFYMYDIPTIVVVCVATRDPT